MAASADGYKERTRALVALSLLTQLPARVWQLLTVHQTLVPAPCTLTLFPDPRACSLHVCMCFQSCPTLCNPMDYHLPGSSVHGIIQARILQWVTMSFSQDLPDPGIEPTSPALAGRFFAKTHLGSVLSSLLFYPWEEGEIESGSRRMEPIVEMVLLPTCPPTGSALDQDSVLHGITTRPY